MGSSLFYNGRSTGGAYTMRTNKQYAELSRVGRGKIASLSFLSVVSSLVLLCSRTRTLAHFFAGSHRSWYWKTKKLLADSPSNHRASAPAHRCQLFGLSLSILHVTITRLVDLPWWMYGFLVQSAANGTLFSYIDRCPSWTNINRLKSDARALSINPSWTS